LSIGDKAIYNKNCRNTNKGLQIRQKKKRIKNKFINQTKNITHKHQSTDTQTGMIRQHPPTNRALQGNKWGLPTKIIKLNINMPAENTELPYKLLTSLPNTYGNTPHLFTSGWKQIQYPKCVYYQILHNEQSP
jgi:hypothetical protein